MTEESIKKLLSIYTSNSKSKKISDIEIIKLIKIKCKNNSNNIHELINYILIDINCSNITTKLKLLHIIEELFDRSSLFRQLLCINLNKLIDSCGLVLNYNYKPNSDMITNKIKVLIESWDSKYGSIYPQLHAISRYLRESLKLTDSINTEGGNINNTNINTRTHTDAIIKRFDSTILEIKFNLSTVRSNSTTLHKCFLLFDKFNEYNKTIQSNIENQCNSISKSFDSIEPSKQLRSIDNILSNNFVEYDFQDHNMKSDDNNIPTSNKRSYNDINDNENDDIDWEEDHTNDVLINDNLSIVNKDTIVTTMITIAKQISDKDIKLLTTWQRVLSESITTLRENAIYRRKYQLCTKLLKEISLLNYNSYRYTTSINNEQFTLNE